MKIKFNPTDGLIVIPTRLHGPKGDIIARLALDTGATGSMINWDIAVLLGYDPASLEERIRITTGSGIEFVPQIKIKKIEIQRRFKKKFPTLCHTLPPGATIDGLLGLDFFRGVRFTIDLKLGTFTFE
jgi:predicted aspartyl protease